VASVVAVRAATPPVIKARHALVRVAVPAVPANWTWFSATAVVPALQRDWGLSAAGAAWLLVAVQTGFITGSITAALLNLPEPAAIPIRFLVGAPITRRLIEEYVRRPRAGGDERPELRCQVLRHKCLCVLHRSSYSMIGNCPEDPAEAAVCRLLPG
jgi:hypothetical protein